MRCRGGCLTSDGSTFNTWGSRGGRAGIFSCVDLSQEGSMAAILSPDLAVRRSWTRLRTFRSVSIGVRRDCDLGAMDPESESDSHTDCSWLEITVDARLGELGGGVMSVVPFAAALGHPLAGMKKAQSR
jgi:hypothetical protein